MLVVPLRRLPGALVCVVGGGSARFAPASDKMSIDGGMKVDASTLRRLWRSSDCHFLRRHVAARFTPVAIGWRWQTLPATGRRYSSPCRPGYVQIATRMSMQVGLRRVWRSRIACNSPVVGRTRLPAWLPQPDAPVGPLTTWQHRSRPSCARCGRMAVRRAAMRAWPHVARAPPYRATCLRSSIAASASGRRTSRFPQGEGDVQKATCRYPAASRERTGMSQGP